jgi:hypothetical protein
MTDLDALVAAFHADWASHVVVLSLVQSHAHAVAVIEPTTLLLALQKFHLSQSQALRLIHDSTFPDDLDKFLTDVLRKIDFKTRALFPRANAYIEGAAPGGLLIHMLDMLCGGPLSAALGQWLFNRSQEVR